MKTIIAGSRTIHDIALVEQAIFESGFAVSKVISGGARGVDTLAIIYAREIGIPYDVFNAKWNKYGRSAGMIRNKEMAKCAEALIAIWDGKSRGTKNMIDIAEERKLKIYVMQIK